MKNVSPNPRPGIIRLITAALLSYTLLMTPLASVAAANLRTGVPSSTKADASTRSAAETPGAATPKEGRAAETSSEAFSPQPAALLAPAAGDVTATMSAAVTVDADSDGKADPGDTITYTTTLDNTTGTSDATGLTFSDTIDSHTTLVNGTLNSTPVAFDRTGAKSVTTDEDTPVNITLSGQDPDADALTFSIVTPPNAAKGALGTLGAPDCATTPGICTATVTYTPNANVNGTDGFTFSVKDSKNANSNQLGTVSITVNAVNDAPTITAPANYSINEDTPKTISDISVADVDAGSGSEQVTLTVQHGAIKINTTGGLTISGNNSASVTMTGTITNLNAGLNGMTYTPAQDFNNTRGSESLGITINDQGNTGTGPVGGISVNKSVPINIAAVNDAPVAKPKSLTAESNMKIRYQINLAADGSGDVTDADKGDGSFTDSFTLASVTPLSCAGCSISIFDASAGTFDFDPPAGFTGGNVTLQYTVTDNGNPLPTQTSAAATITVAVSGPIIWFVNLGAGSNGDGRLSNPFNSLASANTAMSNNGSTNQRIFVYSTTANTTAASGAGVTLQAGQWLIGQGATDTNNTTSFDTFMGITPPSNTIARPSLTGTRPTIQGRVQMNGSNTRVQSFDIKPPAGTQGLTGTNGSAPGAGTAMTGMQVGVSAAKSDVTVTTTGQSGTNAMAVSLTNAGGTFSFISISANQDLSSNKPAKGVSLSSVTGSFNVLGTGTTAGSGGTIQNVSGNGFEIIGASSAPSLTLKNLNLTNTAQTNGNSPGNCLNGTLVASGTASCTAGLFMSGVTSVTLDNVNINGTKQYGINGIGVSGLTMQNGTQVQSAGDEQGEGGVFFQNLTGTATISNFTAKNNIGAQFEVDNLASGSLTFNVTGSSFNGLGKANVNSNQGLYLHPDASGANITATVNSTTFFNNHSYGLQGNADNSGHLTMNVGLTAACKFGDISGGAVANANSNGMFLATSSGASQIDYDVENNSFNGDDITSFSIQQNSSANASSHHLGTFVNNTIGTAGVANSGSSLNNNGDGVTGNIFGPGTFSVNAHNNTIREVEGMGIDILAAGGAGGTTTLKIFSNTISPAAVAHGFGIFVQAGNSSNGAVGTFCANIGAAGANTLSGTSWGDGSGIQIRVISIVSSVFGLQGYSGGSTDVAAVAAKLTSQNNSATAAARITSTSGNGTFGPGNCALMFSPGGIPAAANFLASLTPFDPWQASEPFGSAPADGFDNFFRSRPAGAAADDVINARLDMLTPVGEVTTSLSQRQLDSVVSAAIERWSATGLTPQQVARLRAVKFAVADLSGSYLGEAEGERILVDRSAAGKGWYVGFDPLSDADFAHAASPTRLNTDPASAPAGHLDLLTAVMHEMGHELRLDDTYLASDRDSLMYGYLTAGERRLPAAGQAANLRPGSLDGPHFLSAGPEAAPAADGGQKQLANPGSNQADYTAMPRALLAAFAGGQVVTINGGGAGFKLPVGKTVTITFQVTLNNPPALDAADLSGGPHVSNHGTLSGAFVNNPLDTNTVNTTVDLFDSQVTLDSSSPTSSSGQSVTFTATVAPTGSPAPPVGTTPTGTVDFKDGSTVICSAAPVTLVSGQKKAQCTTSTLGNGPHTITAVYSGDGNFEPPTTPPSLSQSVAKSDTTTTLASSHNPSFVGENVTFTATVTSNTSVTGPPQGTVKFTYTDSANVTPVTICNAQALDTSGKATCQTNALNQTDSPHTIKAEYTSNDNTFNDSSGTLSQAVTTCTPNPVVTSTLDDGSAGTLRDAITNICPSPDNTITFSLGGGLQTITLSTQLVIGSDLKINGPSAPADRVTVSGNNGVRVFNVNSGKTVSISNLTVSGGKVTGADGSSGSNGSDAQGGGILNAGTLTLTNVIVSGNHATGGVGGSDTTAGGAGGNAKGGGIFNSGTLTLTNSTVNGNNSATGGKGGSSDTTPGDGGAGFGGGVFNTGTLTLTDSTVDANAATGGAGGDKTGGGTGANGSGAGGGVYNDGSGGPATLTISNSTISANTATQNGGGIFNSGTGTNAAMSLTNSTVSGNSAINNGGGLYNDNATATTTLTNVTLTLNRADAGNAGAPTAGPGGGIKIVTGTVTMNNTIVAGNVTGASGNPNAVADDISGTVDASSSYNLIGTGGSGGLVDVSTDTAHNNQVGVADAKLGALASNGGPTKTHAPADDSPAIDKGKNFAVDGSSNPILKDQRGFTRPVDIGTVTNAANGDASDIGAFEKQATPDPPGVPDLVDASDSGAHNDDNYTNVTTPQFNIASVTIGATVELLRDGNSVASVTASGTSVSLTDNTVPSDGVYSYTARQTVSAVQSAPSGAINPSVTIDTAAPGKPSTPVLKPSDDSGAADGVTNVTTPTFTGTAEPNSAVQLFANGNLVGAGPADNGGAWSIASSVLADGSYNISAKATDLAGNVSIKSDDLPVTIDATAPTVSMSSTALNPTNVSPIPVTVTFSESVTGFSSSDITASNATVGNFAGSGASYSFELTPLSQGPVSADIAANVATDTAGNGNTAAVQFNRTYNTDAPTVSITAVSPDPRHTSVSSIQIVFSKAVTGFDLSHLSLTLDGGSNLLTGSQTLNSADSGKTWTLGNLSGLTGADGVYTLTLTPSGITDTAGNPLTAGATETWKMDTVPPTVSVAKDAGQADPTHGPTASTVINFTITFNEAVTGFSSTGVNKTGAAGVTATGVTVSQTDADGKIYNVGVEGMTKAGPVTIDILAGAATDDAGNGNTASPGSATVNFTPDNFSTLEVNTTADHADDGCDALGTGAGHQDCTLREAINAANNDFGAETITFNIPTSDPGYDAGTGRYTIKLSFASAEDSNSALYVNGDVTITGPGANLLTVQRDNAAPRFRVFRINSGTVNISGLTVAGGFTADGVNGSSGTNGADGGGISNAGTLTLTGVTVSGNRTGKGGDGSSSSGGRGGNGGGIFNSGTLTLADSTVSGNQTGAGGTGSPGGPGGNGGGIFNSGTLTLADSTVSGNQTGAGGSGAVGGFGGGIFNNSGTLTVANSTITNNSTGSPARGGGIDTEAGTVTVKSSIIAGNSASPGPDVFGSFTSQGFNLVGKSDNSTGFTDATDQKGTVASALDAQLLALADNGGPTQTHSLQCTSPAIDKGKNFVLDINSNLLPDQRGLARPFDLSDSVYPNANGGDGSDIGAVELHSGSGCIPAAVSPNPQPSTNEDTAVTITLKGTYSQSSPALTFTVTQQPAHGALSNPSAVNCTFANSTNTCTQTIKYTPASNFNGLDSFKFKASTAALDSDEADVNITVGAVNDPPVAIPQSVATDEDTPLPVTLTGTDVDSTTLTFQIVAGPSHGSLSGTAPNVTYTPAANYNGPDSFTFKANDGQADSNIAKVSITVNAVNDPPVAADETYNTSENTPLSVAVASGVLKNDTDIDSVGLTAQVVAAPTHSASFTLNADGSFAYTPAANFVGTDTFTYKANDGSASNNLSNVATVTIKVGAGGTLQFNSATYSVTENAGTVTVTVTRTGSSNGAASIHYATVAGGTATGAAACAAGVDFVNTSGTLNWADGDAADKTFTVTICDDSLFEQDETVNLALSNVAGSAELGAQAAAVLTIHDDDSKGGVFGFSQPTYTVGESAGFVTITVTRTGDTTRASAVDYATDDGSDPHVFVPCDSTTGIALERCDYTAAFGTLQFAAGETSKTFVVLISDDSYAEGNEVTTLKLSNPTNGSALGSQAAAMLQIQDDVPESQGNRNDDDEQFVRQHYHDFLGREADADGLKFWTDGIKACGSDAGCREVKRINTSAAFFLSIEFQNTGFFAYRVFKAAFGDATGTFNDSQGSHQLSVPAIRLHEFLRDTREVGQGVIVTQDDWPAHLDSNKSAFALEFVQRDEFLARYPGLTSATAFVNTLDANTGGVMTDQQKSELIAELSPNPADAALRADVLRKVADNAAFMSAESNRAFVLIEYFGYLRRNPDDAPDTDHSGYQFWLQKLNQFHGNFVKAEMIKAFISSDEYRRRFGQ